MRPLIIGESNDPPPNILLAIFPAVDKALGPPLPLLAVLFTSACVFWLMLSRFCCCTGKSAESCLLASVTAVLVSFKVACSTLASVAQTAPSGELDRPGTLAHP